MRETVRQEAVAAESARSAAAAAQAAARVDATSAEQALTAALGQREAAERARDQAAASAAAAAEERRRGDAALAAATDERVAILSQVRGGCVHVLQVREDWCFQVPLLVGVWHLRGVYVCTVWKALSYVLIPPPLFRNRCSPETPTPLPPQRAEASAERKELLRLRAEVRRALATAAEARVALPPSASTAAPLPPPSMQENAHDGASLLVKPEPFASADQKPATRTGTLLSPPPPPPPLLSCAQSWPVCGRRASEPLPSFG